MLWRLCLLCALVAAGAGLGQSGPRPVTLKDAVAIALEKNGAVLQADQAADLGTAAEIQSYAALAPSVSVSSNASRTFGRSFSAQEGRIVRGTSDFVGAGIDADIELFSGLEGVATILRARQQSMAAKRWRARVRQDVIFQVTEAFVTLLQSRTLEDVRAGQLAAQDELLGLVQRLVDVGRAPPSDLFQQQAAQAEARVALVDARRDVGQAEIRLRQILQLPSEERVTFVGPELGLEEEPLLAPEENGPDVERLVDDALTVRPDLAAMQAEVSAAEHGVLAAQSGFWPRLSLTAGYGTNWSSQDHRALPGTGLPPRLLTVQPDDGGGPVTFPVPGTGTEPITAPTPVVEQLLSRHGGSVSFLLTVPLFDGLETWQRLRQAQAELAVSEIVLRQQRAQVAAQVEQAVLDERAARARVSATAARRKAAEQARDAARRRYELGRATFVEVTQAEARYVEARSAHVRAAYDVLLTDARVDYQAGSLSPEAGEAPAEVPR